MGNKKKPEPAASPEDQALEQRVKVIMGEGAASAVPAAQPLADSPAPASNQPLDIFQATPVPAAVAEAVEQANEQPESASEEPETIKPQPSTNLEDPGLDDAVDDIVHTESDTVLASEDDATKANQPTLPKQSSKFKRLLKSKWSWVAAVVLILGMIFAVPATRYTILGLFIKQSVNVVVSDSTTHTPVSGAQVTAHGVSAKTDAAGKAQLKVPLGQTQLTVTKQYYQSVTKTHSVGLTSGQPVAVSLVATGRQVPITVLNKITGKPLANALITVLDTSARTNAKGVAIIVLPTKKASDSATVTLSGYNPVTTNVTVTSSVVSANTVNLTPAGKIYFLSNLNGTIDVVKTNLDGTERVTVLKGTGKEDPNTTSLLASRDWHFLVLKAQRDTAQPSLYIIDTTTDKLTSFDGGDANFSLVGWYGHYFIYDTTRNSVQLWQSGRDLLKSYNADTAQLNQLDQNQAEGTSAKYAYLGFYNFYIVNNLVAYNTQWYTSASDGTTYDLTGKSDTIRGVQPNGQGKKDYQQFGASGVGYINAALYEPQNIYYAVSSYVDNKATYYEFENQAVKTVTNISDATFSQTYPTYLLAPGGDQTFWSELRDGKNSLFVGDANAGSKTQIASLSDYAPYGWYSDSYLLVSKSSSQLYIMPKAGLSAGQQPLKITDYYKPAQTYNGYGYGYGGL